MPEAAYFFFNAKIVFILTLSSVEFKIYAKTENQQCDLLKDEKQMKTIDCNQNTGAVLIVCMRVSV